MHNYKLIGRRAALGVVLVGAVTLASCAPKAPLQQASVAPSPFKITATIQDIMKYIVDPAADSLWESVATTVTAAGTDEKQPRTDAEWAAVRQSAITLVEATNLLAMDGRLVVAQGKSLEDSHVAGINKPEDIQRSLDDTHALFVDFAHQLHDAGVEALTAIDSKSVEGLVAAGGKMDTACEQCHLHYWYPNSPRPGALTSNNTK